MIRIDPNSENYQPYMAECKKLGEWFDEETAKLLEIHKVEHYRGRDDPRSSCIYRELSHRLKELQIKYGYREKLP